MIGGFMGVGTPARLIAAIVPRGTRDLTLIANDTAMPGRRADPTGLGTEVEDGKQKIVVQGRT